MIGVIDVTKMLADNPEALKAQMETQRLAIEMLDKVKALIDERFDHILSTLENAPEGGRKFVMLHNSKVVTNVIAAHMLTRLVGEPPSPPDLEHYLAMCAVQGYADHAKQQEDLESAQ